MGVDNVLHDHVKGPHVLDLAVHLVIFLAGWVTGIIHRTLMAVTVNKLKPVLASKGAQRGMYVYPSVHVIFFKREL